MLFLFIKLFAKCIKGHTKPPSRLVPVYNVCVDLAFVVQRDWIFGPLKYTRLDSHKTLLRFCTKSTNFGRLFKLEVFISTHSPPGKSNLISWNQN